MAGYAEGRPWRSTRRAEETSELVGHCAADAARFGHPWGARRQERRESQCRPLLPLRYRTYFLHSWFSASSRGW